jgi:ABC-type sugar transport system permease subunit
MPCRGHRLFMYVCVGLMVFLYFGTPGLETARAGGSGQLWHLKTGDIVYATATSSDGSFTVIGSRDSDAYALDRAGKRLWQFHTGNVVTAVAVSPDGAYAAVASAASTLTLLTRAGHVVWEKTVGGPLGAVALTMQATRVAYGVNNTSALNKDLHLYMLAHDGRRLWTTPLTGSPRSIAIAPDGRHIVVGADDDSVTSLDGNGRQIWQQGGNNVTDGVAISSDGSRVAAASEDFHVYFYDGAGQQLWTYAADDMVHAVAMSADGSRIAAASEDGSVYLLNAYGTPIYREVTGHATYAVALSSDARLLIYGLDNGTAVAVDVGAALANSAADQRVLHIRIALAVVAMLGLCALCTIYLRVNMRARTAVVRRAARARYRAWRVWRGRISYVLLIPTFALLLIFNYYPAISGLYHSLTQWQPGVRTRVIGLANFQAMLSDHYLAIGVVNLLILLATGIIKTLLFPFLVAEVIFHLRSRRAQYWARTAFVIPIIVPAVASILLWRFIYDPNLGLANEFLKAIGLSGWTHSWLGEPGYALGSIIFIGFPWVSALPLLVLYAGLIAIPFELLEAATVDGARELRRITSIHIPLLMGQVKLLLILLFIGGIQDFQGILILTGGGPLDSTYVPGLDLYYNATRFDNLGYASAIGVALFVVVMGITILQLRYVRTATEYQA